MNIKHGKEKKYQEYVAMNTDPYGKSCVEAGEAVMKLLDEGKTPEQAAKGLRGFGLTGYMAGAAIIGVCKFHRRGDEMKYYWNHRNIKKLK